MKTETQSENPGPNMSWCPGCNAWKMFARLERHGDTASTATYTRHCHTCGAQLERRPL
jgi:hypothetical protein